MKSFALLVLLMLLPLHASQANEMKTLDHKVDGLKTSIEHWKAEQLKDILMQRITDNQTLIDLYQHVPMDETELDKAYALEIKALLQDQKALIEITNELAVLDQEARLHLGIYLDKRPALKSRIEKILNHNMQSESIRKVVNQVLYFTLMEKYANR